MDKHDWVEIKNFTGGIITLVNYEYGGNGDDNEVKTAGEIRVAQWKCSKCGHESVSYSMPDSNPISPGGTEKNSFCDIVILSEVMES